MRIDPTRPAPITRVPKLHDRRYFSTDDPEGLIQRLRSLLASDGFEVQQIDDATLIAAKYDADDPHKRDQAELRLSPDASRPQGRTRLDLDYYRYERIIGDRTAEYIVPLNHESRAQFDQLTRPCSQLS